MQLPPKRDIDEDSEKQGHVHIEEAIHHILLAIGEDPNREGLVHTPERVSRMYAELTVGYQSDLTALVNSAIFHVDYSDMIVVADIDFSSLCEHHLLPFFGKVHVAYVPDGRVIGLSKIPRIVEMYARRLQIQERMTSEIAAAVQSLLDPKGVAVVIEALHLCSTVRGIKKANVKMITKAMRGIFVHDWNLRTEFLTHIKHKADNDQRYHETDQDEEVFP